MKVHRESAADGAKTMAVNVEQAGTDMHFVHAVALARGYIEATATNPVEIKLLNIYDKLRDLCETGEAFRKKLSRSLVEENLTEETLRSNLAVVSLVGEGLRILLKARACFEQKYGEDLPPSWPDEFQNCLSDLNDELEDLGETIALRLNVEFQGMIETAIAEARQETPDTSNCC